MIRLPSNLGALRRAWRASADADVSRETPCFRIVDADAATPKLYVYDVIGGWDNDAAEFVRAVHALDAPAVDLHINSPGGFVFDAVSMYEALAAHPSTVNVHIDGLAASAASFLAQAGDSISIARGGRMMIHDAQGVGIGSPADLREYADLLDAVSNDIAGYYAERAGGKATAWRGAMSATTWYSAQEAVDAGLADNVTSKQPGPDNRTRIIQARHRALTTLGG
jgi:ATP-dependent protease ClpP protease subunit